MELNKIIAKYLKIDEGIWSLPKDADASKLKQLFSKPITAKQARKDFWNLVGSDTFHDMLGDLEEKAGSADVRALIAYYVGNRFQNVKCWQTLAREYEQEAKKSPHFKLVNDKLKQAQKYPNS